LILRIISRFDATRCQILRLKCIKFDFHSGCAPDPAGRAYSAPQDPLAVFKGATSKGREEEEGRVKRGRRRRQGRGGAAPKYFGLEPPVGAGVRGGG